VEVLQWAFAVAAVTSPGSNHIQRRSGLPGERSADDPVFRRPVSVMAMLYDLQTDSDLRPRMTYRAEDGTEAGLSFIIPRSRDDLVRRRQAMRVWAGTTFGLMGRSPDFLNTVVASWADAPEFFAECGPEAADNVQRYYRYCRDNDLFLTHTLVNPPVDRSKSASWERVFLHGNVTLANTMFAGTGLQRHTGHQTSVRGLAKCEFMTALAIALSRSVKTDGFMHVQEQLGECISYLQLIEGAIVLSEQKAEVTKRGTHLPALEPLQALRYHIPRFYERMVRLTQIMGAGGLLANPTKADLDSEIGDDIRRYYRGADSDAEAKIRLSKLAWDATGTQFGQRQLQYERYYAGDPVRTGASIYTMSDQAPLLAVIERALRLPPEHPN
jgi:aromatic ring hydroxylase